MGGFYRLMLSPPRRGFPAYSIHVILLLSERASKKQITHGMADARISSGEERILQPLFLTYYSAAGIVSRYLVFTNLPLDSRLKIRYTVYTCNNR